MNEQGREITVEEVDALQKKGNKALLTILLNPRLWNDPDVKEALDYFSQGLEDVISRMKQAEKGEPSHVSPACD